MLWSAGEVEAQTGTISGRVVDARTLQPVASAQVFIPALNTGALSREDGRYILVNVPAGSHTVNVQILGFRNASAEVTVASGQTATADFQIEQDALALDAVVVTGTPGGTRQRAVGNVVGRVQAAEITEVAPVQTMQDLLGSREPGLSFSRSSGNVGTGSQIRIRGISSLSMSSQPLVYVDGVRVDNQGAAGPNIRDGRQVSKLDDFSPDQIESIEIIKGPAAATLYGTEASAGVIQIITKKGASGAPQFDVSVRQGTTWLMNPSEKIGTSWGRDEAGQVQSFNIWDVEKEAGRQFFDAGHLQTYSASMRGGTDAIRYYLSADIDRNVGIVDYNWDRGLSTRANVTIMPSTKLTMDVSTGYVASTTSFMQQYTGYGVWEQAQWASPLGRDRSLRGFLRARPEEIEDVEATRDNNRFTVSGTATHMPTEWLTQRLILGTDVSQEKNQILFPRHPDGANHDFLGNSLGMITVERPYTRYDTFDYAVSAKYGFGPSMAFTTSFGAQYYNRFEEVVSAEGRVFPAPAIRTLGGAASTTSSSTQVQNKSFGMYLQQEASYLDRFFLTAAVRGDDNSAFGANYDAAIYPKLSATWVVSEENFFANYTDWVNSLRLRGAWGKAGRQPDTFAGVTLFAPRTGPGGTPAVTPDLLGNPDLGPEVSTELEVGFDAAFLQDRVSTQFTYYTQKVNDALLNVPVPWSLGFPGSQSVNLGQISNWGWELSADTRVLEQPNVAVDFGFALSSNQNRIDDLAGNAESATVIEGWNYPAVTRRLLTSAEFDAEGNVVNVTCDQGREVRNGYGLPGGEAGPCTNAPLLRYENGYGIPKFEGNFNASVTLFQNLRLHGLVDWQGEHYRTLTDASCRHTCFWTSEVAVKRHEMDAPWAANAIAAIDSKITSSPYVNTFNASFARVRELGATYSLPSSFAGRIGASNASINVAARNLWFLHRAQTEIAGAPVHDPEARGLVGGEGGGGNVNLGSNSNVPPLASFLITLRASF